MKARIDARQKAIPIPDLSSYTFAKVMQKCETTKYFRKNMPKDFPIVSLDPETLRKYFIEKTNQNTKAKGKSELIY